jgi:site-specific recombinase XerD
MDERADAEWRLDRVGTVTPTVPTVPELPPLLACAGTPEVRRRLEEFYTSVAEILERWVARRASAHTRRAYRRDVMAFVEFLGLRWPDDAVQMYAVTVAQVQDYREHMLSEGKAPKTRNRRIASLSSWYKFLQACAAELRLPIVVPNPAHAQFIGRSAADPREETRALSAARARQLMAMPAGDSLLDCRDRAIIKFYLYSGARISAGCRLTVGDFHRDGDEATVRLHEKGDRWRMIGLHFAAAEAIAEYIDRAGITRGPLFRARRSSRSTELADRQMNPATMYLLMRGYLRRLPGAMKEPRAGDPDGIRACIYTPHSLRATTATLLLGAGVDIIKVKDLLGHRHVTTTQIYDKRRRSLKEGASHDVPI